MTKGSMRKLDLINQLADKDTGRYIWMSEGKHCPHSDAQGACFHGKPVMWAECKYHWQEEFGNDDSYCTLGGESDHD